MFNFLLSLTFSSSLINKAQCSFEWECLCQVCHHIFCFHSDIRLKIYENECMWNNSCKYWDPKKYVSLITLFFIFKRSLKLESNWKKCQDFTFPWYLALCIIPVKNKKRYAFYLFDFMWVDPRSLWQKHVQTEGFLREGLLTVKELYAFPDKLVIYSPFVMKFYIFK